MARTSYETLVELDGPDIPAGRSSPDDYGYPRHTLVDAVADLSIDYTLSDALAEFGTPIPKKAVWRANMTDHVAAQGDGPAPDRESMLRSRLARSGVPSLYLDVPPSVNVVKRVEDGRGLYLHGDVGVGKTWSACQICRAWAERGREFLFRSSLDLLTAIRSTYEGRESEAAVMREFAEVPLLVVDDLGKEVPTAWALSKLFDIVNKRYESRLPTVFTSQYDPKRMGDLIARSGDRDVAYAIVSRIIESCDVLPLNGENRRLRRQ